LQVVTLIITFFLILAKALEIFPDFFYLQMILSPSSLPSEVTLRGPWLHSLTFSRLSQATKTIFAFLFLFCFCFVFVFVLFKADFVSPS